MDEKNIAPLKDEALEQVSGGEEYESGNSRPEPNMSSAVFVELCKTESCPSSGNQKHSFSRVGFYNMLSPIHSGIYTKYRCQFCNKVVYVKM